MNDYSAGRIPAHMLERLRAYIDHGHPTGDFLRAVLCNDLREACGRADDCNILILPAYVTYLYNEAPAACWGSPEKVAMWVARHGAKAAGSRT